jgi:hypothetical protein
MGAGHEQENLTPTTATLELGKQRGRFFAWLHRQFPEGRDKAAAGAAVFSFCAVVLSLSAFLMTLHQNKAVNAVAVASTFSNLRTHYHATNCGAEIKMPLPAAYGFLLRLPEQKVRVPDHQGVCPNECAASLSVRLVTKRHRRDSRHDFEESTRSGHQV